MSEQEPVLVVHGVANHDREKFEGTVEALRQRVGARFRLIPVFWGDLGGQSTGLGDALPVLFPRIDTTRAGAQDTEAFFGLVQEQRAALMGAELTRGAEAAVVDALHAATLQVLGAQPTGMQVTRGDDALHQALSEQVPSTRYLKQVYEPQLQQAVGELLAGYLRAPLADGPVGVPPEGFVMRGWVDDGMQAFKTFIGKVDELIGRVVSNVAGSVNQWVRDALAKPIALTLGDVVAYHQARCLIHERLFEVLDKKARGYGTEQQPITVMAHSLGGLVTFDAALGSDVLLDGEPRRLHIKRWITFGSQPAFFHVMAPRNGIEKYTSGKRVRLPPSIGSWTNLWHPLDLLAFSAASVFCLHKDSLPVDVRVDSSASEIASDMGWLHSSYWESTELQDALLAGAEH